MGATVCTCVAPAQGLASAARELGRSPKADSKKKVPAEEIWAPPNSALVTSANARMYGRLACCGSVSYMVAKQGFLVRLKWSGSNDHFGLGTPPITLPDVLRIPARVVQIAAGEGHALFLTHEDNRPRLFSVGDNQYGQLGLGDTMSRVDLGKAHEIFELGGQLIAGVAAGGQVSMALSQRGDVWSWGRNEESGVLGLGTLPVICVPTPLPIGSIRRKIRAAQMATSGWTALCISHLGAVYSWGGGKCGVHGQGHQEDEPYAKVVRGLEGITTIQIACGPLHAVTLGEQGEVYTWGRLAGAFGHEASLQLYPKMIDSLLGIRIVQIAAGHEHCLALGEGGEVYGWGAHAAGALNGTFTEGNSKQMYSHVHHLQLGPVRVKDIACGPHHSAFSIASDDDRPGPKGTLLLCGLGAPPEEHVASLKEGALARGDWTRAFLPPSGTPLKLTPVDIKKVLQLTG